MTQGDRPHWQPLMDLVMTGWMWMFEVCLSDGRKLHAYKHRWTRRYIHLAEDGTGFLYLGGKRERYEEVDPLWLLEEALGPLFLPDRMRMGTPPDREVRRLLRSAGWSANPPVGLARVLAEPRWQAHGHGRRQRLGHGPRRYACCDATRDWSRSPSMNRYLVVYERADDGGWGAHAPDVDGVFAVGASREEVESRMADALAAHLALLRERGEPLPRPRTQAGHVAA
jgi:predicted RNase H-like HicB family nuclease